MSTYQVNRNFAIVKNCIWFNNSKDEMYIILEQFHGWQGSTIVVHSGSFPTYDAAIGYIKEIINYG